MCNGFKFISYIKCGSILFLRMIGQVLQHLHDQRRYLRYMITLNESPNVFFGREYKQTISHHPPAG